MFKTDKMYKHKLSTDVAFRPYSVAYNDNHVLLEGFWINIVMGDNFVIDSDRIKVKNEDVDMWKEYVGE